jgi:MFS family permease
LRKDPVLAATSIIMAVVFVSAYNFQVSLALIASDVLVGDSRVYGSLMSALGLGAAVGSLILARRARTGLDAMLVWTAVLAVTQMAVAGVQDRLAVLAATFAYGVGAGLFSVTAIATLQARTADDMRGRVLALYSICFMGSSLLGGPIFGALSQWIGVPGALRVTGSVCAIVALIGLVGCQAAKRFERAG